MNEVLRTYIHELLPIDSEKIDYITQDFTLHQLVKDGFLIKENTISSNTYFLEKGYIRSFIMDNDGNEITVNIFSAPCFVNDFLSFFKQQPTKENFQALTPCVIKQMSYEQLQLSFHNIPEFREFGRMMLVANYSKLNDRMISMINDSAEERYLKLWNQNSVIFQNVPLKIIASYLGIKDTSLSRIRKKIITK